MAYIGQSIKNGTFKDLGFTGTFNSSTTDFNLGTQLGSAAQILVSKNGVIQRPGTDFTLASGGSQISFTTAPASGDSIFIVEISGAVGGPMNRDINGEELILDVDGDTSIHADTDDQMDFKIGGTDEMTISSSGIVINEGSNDRDFRVETNGNANTFIVDGGEDKIGIGAAPTQAKLHIITNDSGALNDGNSDDFMIENTSATGMTIGSSTDGEGHIHFSDSDDADVGTISYFHSNNRMQFRVNAAERMRIDNSGNLLVGKQGSASSSVGCEFLAHGEIFVTRSGQNVGLFNRLSDDGQIFGFLQANNTEGTINVSGSTVSYNGFTGTHWSRLADNSKPTILRGTIMESLDEMCDWYQAVADVAEVKDSEGNVTTAAHQVKEYINLGSKSVGDSITFTSRGVEYTGKIEKEGDVKHAKTKVSDTEASKSVYGLFVAWDNDDTNYNDMLIAQTGTFVIRIHKDETVSKGDLIQSKGDGTGKVQADDIMRASTVAKVLSTTKIETYSDGSYIVPCSLHC